MDKLSTELREKITSRPLKTLVDDSDDQDPETTRWRRRMFVYVVAKDIPVNFDGRKIWKGYLSEIGNQGSCGSCWAWASSSVLADRIAIKSQGKIKITLSPLYLVICDLRGMLINSHLDSIPGISVTNEILTDLLSAGIGEAGCHGNTLMDVWKWLSLRGTPTDECLSYEAQKDDEFISLTEYKSDDQLPLCTEISGPTSDMCGDFTIDNNTGRQGGKPARFYRSICYYCIPGNASQGGSEDNIKTEILYNGPVTSGMRVYPDFYEFDAKHSIYRPQADQPRVGGHAVRIVGWGSKNDDEYWIIANSWGTSWGRNGFFYMERGTDTCGIESNVTAGLPDLFYPSGVIFPKETYRYIDAMNGGERDTRLSIDYGAEDEFRSGGIDPRTGYYRRALYSYTGYDFSPLIDIGSLLKLLTNPIHAYQDSRSIAERFTQSFPTMPPEEVFLIAFMSISVICLIYMCISRGCSRG